MSDNKALTLEQLREMDGQPVYCGDRKEWGIIHIDNDGAWANVPFFRGVYCDLDVQHNGLTLYAYPPAHIDREAWSKCGYCGRAKIKMVRMDLEYNESPGSPERLNPNRYPRFCPICGKPLNETAWAELEKRLNG